MSFDAYFFSLQPTGDTAIDAILEAVADAGKGCHSTEDWNEHGFTAAIQQAALDAAANRRATPAQADADARDAARLMFAMQDIDGFGLVRMDKHDYAIAAMEEAGRDEPTEEDELNGIRRLIDAAIAQQARGG